MIEALLQSKTADILQVLCIGAHCDDIEIGCGGTLLKWIEQKRLQSVFWVVFASNPVRKKEALESAQQFLKAVPKKEIIVLDYKDAFLPYEARTIKAHFEDFKTQFNPDVVFTHYRHDRHQDHRLLSDLAWNTFRNTLILEYEIPKYDGDFGQPNVFVELSPQLAQQKIEYILQFFESQHQKHWFDTTTFEAILRLRAMESASHSKYAEAFYARKLKLL